MELLLNNYWERIQAECYGERVQLQYGANPDQSVPVQTGKYEASVAASAFYRASGSSHPVLFHYVMMVAQRPEYMNDPEQRFASLIYLYYMCMSHTQVYSTLGSLLRAQEAGVIPVRATALFTLIKDLHSKPRTLKQMVRLVIYQSLDHKPGVYVNKLSLPTSLKEYLLNFDP